MYPIMFGGPAPGDKEKDKLKEVLGWVDGFVKDDKFAAGGDTLTLADICLLATYTTLKATGAMDLSEYEKAERALEHSSSLSWLDQLSADSHFILCCVHKD